MRKREGGEGKPRRSDRGGREKDRASWPTWANNSSEMRVWLKGPPCPSSTQLSVGGRQADQNSPGLVQVLHLQRQMDNFGTRALVAMAMAAT